MFKSFPSWSGYKNFLTVQIQITSVKYQSIKMFSHIYKRVSYHI